MPREETITRPRAAAEPARGFLLARRSNHPAKRKVFAAMMNIFYILKTKLKRNAKKFYISEEFKSHQYLLLYDVTYVIIHYVFVYYGN